MDLGDTVFEKLTGDELGEVVAIIDDAIMVEGDERYDNFGEGYSARSLWHVRKLTTERPHVKTAAEIQVEAEVEAVRASKASGGRPQAELYPGGKTVILPPRPLPIAVMNSDGWGLTGEKFKYDITGIMFNDGAVLRWATGISPPFHWYTVNDAEAGYQPQARRVYARWIALTAPPGTPDPKLNEHIEPPFPIHGERKEIAFKPDTLASGGLNWKAWPPNRGTWAAVAYNDGRVKGRGTDVRTMTADEWQIMQDDLKAEKAP